jgi:hypothetical protein
MALRQGEWRGHPQWICDEHGFETLVEATAAEHVAEFHADEAAPAADTEAAPPEKKGK